MNKNEHKEGQSNFSWPPPLLSTANVTHQGAPGAAAFPVESLTSE
jgi:hypothetical protein